MCHEDRGRGITLAWLQDEAIAGRNRNGEHPARHHARKVKGGDARHDAQGLTQCPVIDAGRDLICEITFKKLRDATCKLNDINAAHDFALGIGKDLAMLLGDDRRQLVLARVEQGQEVVHDAGATQRWRVSPGCKRALCARDGGCNGLGGGELYLA